MVGVLCIIVAHVVSLIPAYGRGNSTTLKMSFCNWLFCSLVLFLLALDGSAAENIWSYRDQDFLNPRTAGQVTSGPLPMWRPALPAPIGQWPRKVDPG